MKKFHNPIDGARSTAEPRLIVHGGAWSIPDEYVDAHINGVKNAVKSIFPQMQNGLSALDAVEKAVNLLEADPTFDAGRGAFLNEIGEIELDAIIADGAALKFGAVAAVRNLLHPVSLARLVMEKTEHCMLVGSGAQRFAKQMGIVETPIAELLTERELTYFNEISKNPDFRTKQPFEKPPMGTVGAVAMDVFGNLAGATSTGGTPRKLPGRVGDTPIYGAGVFADNLSGAASATGWGESIMQSHLCLKTCDAFGNLSPMIAAKQAIERLHNRFNGLGGVIAINAIGEYAFAHNTSRMAFAFAMDSGEVVAEICRSE